jgi:RNA polymerase sigma-70 factor (ECF subfamily)
MVYDKRKMDEIALVQSAQEGSADAFKLLFEDNKRRILNLAYQYTKNVEDSEDIVQDTFIKAYHSLQKFNIGADTNFSAWLYRIGINCSIDHLRKNKRQKDNIMPTDDMDGLSAPTNNSNPDNTNHKREVREKLEQVLDTLTKRQRMIFILKHYQELSIKEIAEYMNCSEGSVKKQLFRAVSAMKKHLKCFLPENRYEMQKV